MNFLQFIAQAKKLINLAKVIGTDDLRKLQKEINHVADTFLQQHHPEYYSYLDFISKLLYQRQKDEIELLPIYEDHNRPVEIITDANLAVTLKKLKKEPVLGFDTESKPVFEKAQKQYTDLFQIATPKTCYIFQINKISHPSQLEIITKDRNIKKVGVGLGSDIKSLKDEFQMKCESFIDLNTIFEHLGRSNNIGSKQLVAAVLGKNLKKNKKTTVSNWQNETLTPEQVAYASDDAFSSIDAYLNLQKSLKDHKPYLSGKLIKFFNF